MRPAAGSSAASCWPGVPLTARHLVGLFVSAPPDWLGALAITALSASMDTGRQTWSFEGAIQLGFTVEILNTPVTIGAGAELELAKTTPAGQPAGKLTGWVSVNRLYLEVRRDIGIDDPTWAIKVQFGELWVQGTTLWRGQGEVKHQAVTIQLGGVTLGGLLEYLVNLAAPTLGFRLEPPWDLLKRVELSRFALTIDPTEKSIELTYAAQVDLGVGTVSKIGVHYELGAKRKVDLILEGTFLGKSFTGADALRWDVIDGSPPTVPGQGEKMLVVRYLGLGQRVRLKNPPDTVPAAIEAPDPGHAPGQARREPDQGQRDGLRRGQPVAGRAGPERAGHRGRRADLLRPRPVRPVDRVARRAGRSAGRAAVRGAVQETRRWHRHVPDRAAAAGPVPPDRAGRGVDHPRHRRGRDLHQRQLPGGPGLSARAQLRPVLLAQLLPVHRPRWFLPRRAERHHLAAGPADHQRHLLPGARTGPGHRGRASARNWRWAR